MGRVVGHLSARRKERSKHHHSSTHPPQLPGGPLIRRWLRQEDGAGVKGLRLDGGPVRHVFAQEPGREGVARGGGVGEEDLYVSVRVC